MKVSEDYKVCKNCEDYSEDEDACYSDEVNKYSILKLNECEPTFGCNKWRMRLDEEG